MRSRLILVSGLFRCGILFTIIEFTIAQRDQNTSYFASGKIGNL